MDMTTIKDVITLVLFAISVYGFMSGRAKDGESRSEQFTKLNVKLDNLCQSNTAIKDSLRDLEKSTQAQGTDIAIMKEQIKVANHRIDDLEHALKKGE